MSSITSSQLPAPPPNDLKFINISSLMAALAKLNVNVSIEDLLKVIHEEDEARCAKFTANAQHRRVVTGAIGSEFTAVSKFIPNPPANVDPLAKERRRRLIELTKEVFPDGKVSDPFSNMGSFDRR